jgi:hypothetical protein
MSFGDWLICFASSEVFVVAEDTQIAQGRQFWITEEEFRKCRCKVGHP